MDIDISGFSKKARRRVYTRVVQPSLWLTFAITMPLLLVMVFLIALRFHEYTGLFNPEGKLAIYAYIFWLGVSVVLFRCFFRNRMSRLEQEEYFRVCFECGKKRQGDETSCQKCGSALKIKKADTPEMTLRQLGLEKIYSLLIGLAIGVPLGLGIPEFIDRGQSSRITMVTVHSEKGNVLKMKYDFAVDHEVLYNNGKAKIAAVGIDSKRNIIYTLDIDGRKVYGVAASELYKLK